MRNAMTSAKLTPQQRGPSEGFAYAASNNTSGSFCNSLNKIKSAACYHEHEYEAVHSLLSLSMTTGTQKGDHSPTDDYTTNSNNDGSNFSMSASSSLNTQRSFAKTAGGVPNNDDCDDHRHEKAPYYPPKQQDSFLSEKELKNEVVLPRKKTLPQSERISCSSSSSLSPSSSSYSEQPEMRIRATNDNDDHRQKKIDKKSSWHPSSDEENSIYHHQLNNNISSNKYFYQDSSTRRTSISNKDINYDHQAALTNYDHRAGAYYQQEKERLHRHIPFTSATAMQQQTQHNFNADTFLHYNDFPVPLTRKRSPPPPSEAENSSRKAVTGVGGGLMSKRRQQEYLSEKAKTIIRSTRKASEKLWWGNFLKLQQFHSQNGNCNVPARYPPDKKLGHWVMTQRHQYQLLKEGKASTLVEDRIDALSSLSFTFSLKMENDQLWHTRFEELKEFKAVHGHCAVPQRYPDNKKLGLWVNTQRSHYNFYQKGQRTCMTLSRIKLLESVDFTWTRSAKAKNRADEDED